MTYHLDATAADEAVVGKKNSSNVVFTGAAFLGTVGLFGLTALPLSVCLGAAVIGSLSLTSVCLVADDKLDFGSAYGAIAGTLFAVATAVSTGVFALSGLGAAVASIMMFAVFMVCELAASSAVAALFAWGKNRTAPAIGVALNINSRLFGLAGRTV